MRIISRLFGLDAGTILRRFGHQHSFSSITFAKARSPKKMSNEVTNNGESSMPVSAAASRVSINVIQNGSFGFYRSVCVSTDHVSYMFNCPETNRRLLSEQGIRRTPSLKHMFFTHGSWKNVAGLPGLLAFLRTIDVKMLRLHGPPGLAKIIQVVSPFNEKYHCHKLHQESLMLEEDGLKIYEDSNVIIECVPFAATLEKEQVLREYLETRTEEQKHFPLHADDLAVAYIGTLKPKWGKILLQKCVESGVKIGPDIGNLQRGLPVINRHGREVHPDEVREPPLPSEHFIIVECPDERFLDSMIRSEAFSKFQVKDESNLKLLVHFSPSRIMETVAYKEWTNRFPSSTTHWICNDSSPVVCHLDGVYRWQPILNNIHKEIFPLLWHHRIISDYQNNDKSAMAVPENVVLATPFTKFTFRPPVGFESIFVEKDKEDQEKDQKVGQKNVQMKKFHEELSQATLSEEIYPSVTFFGTAAASPSKHRNVSCISLDLDENISILFDCGESSISQMQLLHGRDLFEKRLVNVKAIFISHLHLDHHFGLYSLILERKWAFEKLQKPYEKLIIVAASPLLNAHLEFSKCVENTNDLYDFRSTAQNDNLALSMEEVSKILGLNKINIVKVIHPQCATGFVLTTKDNKKIVYSGDTRPCEDLVDAGRDADLLIHEATLNDGWDREAVFKKHCTKSEALAVSKTMNAKWTILTHFTGVNTKLPYVDEELLKECPNVGLAYDFMTVRWNQLPLLPKIIPVLYEIYADEVNSQQGKYSRKRVTIDDDEKLAKVKSARVD